MALNYRAIAFDSLDRVLPVVGDDRQRAQLSVGTSSEVSLKVTEADIGSLTATIKKPSGAEEPCQLKRLANGHLGKIYWCLPYVYWIYILAYEKVILRVFCSIYIFANCCYCDSARKQHNWNLAGLYTVVCRNATTSLVSHNTGRTDTRSWKVFRPRKWCIQKKYFLAYHIAEERCFCHVCWRSALVRTASAIWWNNHEWTRYISARNNSECSTVLIDTSVVVSWSMTKRPRLLPPI